MPDDVLQRALREISRLVFSLPESHGFVPVALDLTDRPTQDIDFFTSDAHRIEAAGAVLCAAAARGGWATSLRRGSATLQRIILRRDDVEVSVGIIGEVLRQ